MLRISFAFIAALGALLCLSPANAEDEDVRRVEEVVTTGTQIKGASIAESLPVSVISMEDIEALGFDSGDELLDFVAENGSNFVNEAENISGGVNAARGDVGAFNLRNLGTGNTLVLLNGRRMVNAASYQTEEIGGSFVPVNSVNSNAIPVAGLERLEVLRDGASAIYGADAVAGVVNHVLQSDFEGFTIRTKLTDYDNLPRNDQTATLQWGKFFSGGKTNVSAFFQYYHRDRVNSQDDPRWANADFRYRIPAGSPWEGSTSFRNDSANSIYGQYDLVTSASAAGVRDIYTDSSGEFETYPAGDPRCQYEIGYGTCGGIDGQGTYRHNLNENRDLVSDLDRYNFFMFVNHELDNGLESFTEVGVYSSKSNLFRHASAPFSTVKLRVGAQNYWNPFGPCDSPNRIDPCVGPDPDYPDGLELIIDNYRFTEFPRIVDNDGKTFRFLTGLRGAVNEWDWESAVLWSRAEKKDITHNRVSNTLAQQALNDSTPNAYNPFSGGVDNNVERVLIDVFRNNETELALIDFKLSRNDFFELPAGPVGLLLGGEYRDEKFIDNRDPRLDGTIVFTDFDGDTYPFVSDVVNSSPTPDSDGSRDVFSLFGELQIPVLSTLDVQLAMRFENFSDVGDTTVGKFAAGWRPLEQLLVRGSWSEAFRAPNLVTINEEIVARQNTRTDYACLYAAENGGDPDQDTLDCRNSTQRIAQGSTFLKPEESTNYSFGIVVDPLQNLTVTLDFWSIEKKDTIGLFGEENHTILDLLNRINHGTADCSSLMANPAVVRETDLDPDEAAIYLAAGICPAGLIKFIEDRYVNLDTRTVEGMDLGIYYNFDTSFGNFDLRYLGAFLDEYTQEAGGDAAVLVDAQNAGILPGNIPVTGFADLIRRDGNPESKQTLRVSWRNGPWGATLSGLRISDFVQESLTLDNGDGTFTEYVVPSMTTYNGTVDYRFDLGEVDARLRFGINNLTDERAPLADRFFGYFADVHRDLGRYYYLDFKLDL